MVTPIWLNGACCATAVPAVSVKAINSVTNTFVFTDASLLISSCLTMRERYQPAVKMSRAFGAKKGEDDGSGRLANGEECFRQMLASKCGKPEVSGVGCNFCGAQRCGCAAGATHYCLRSFRVRRD